MLVSFQEFSHIIQDCYNSGHRLSLESEDLGHVDWPSERFVDYLLNIEGHKAETGIKTKYELEHSLFGDLIGVTVSILFPQKINARDNSHYIHWIVK